MDKWTKELFRVAKEIVKEADGIEKEAKKIEKKELFDRVAKEVAKDGLVDSINDLWEQLSEFEFGAHLDSGKYGYDDSEETVSHYSFPSVDQTLEAKQGTCLDIACLAKILFDESGIRNFAVFYIFDDEGYFPRNHCFNVVEHDGGFILFDASEKLEVKKYKSLAEIIDLYKDSMKKEKGTVKFYKLKMFPPTGSSFGNFVEFATGCEEIK